MKNGIVLSAVVVLLSTHQVYSADFTLKSGIAAPYISGTTGEIVVRGLSSQTTITLGHSFGEVYAYVGTFANYNLKLGKLTEFDPYVGVAFPLGAKIKANASVTFVTDGKRLVGMSGEFVLGRPFRSREWTITPQIVVMPQWVPRLPDGIYFKASTTFEWRPKIAPKLKLKIKPSIVYDTGAYGAHPGFSQHLEFGLRLRLTKSVDGNLGFEIHRTRNREINTAITASVIFRF